MSQHNSSKATETKLWLRNKLCGRSYAQNVARLASAIRSAHHLCISVQQPPQAHEGEKWRSCFVFHSGFRIISIEAELSVSRSGDVVCSAELHASDQSSCAPHSPVQPEQTTRETRHARIPSPRYSPPHVLFR